MFESCVHTVKDLVGQFTKNPPKLYPKRKGYSRTPPSYSQTRGPTPAVSPAPAPSSSFTLKLDSTDAARLLEGKSAAFLGSLDSETDKGPYNDFFSSIKVVKDPRKTLAELKATTVKLSKKNLEFEPKVKALTAAIKEAIPRVREREMRLEQKRKKLFAASQKYTPNNIAEQLRTYSSDLDTKTTDIIEKFIEKDYDYFEVKDDDQKQERLFSRYCKAYMKARTAYHLAEAKRLSFQLKYNLKDY